MTAAPDAEPLGLALPDALLVGEALSDGEALSVADAVSDGDAPVASGVAASCVVPVAAAVASPAPWVASFCAGAWFWVVFPQPTSNEALSSAAEPRGRIFWGRFMVPSIARPGGPGRGSVGRSRSVLTTRAAPRYVATRRAGHRVLPGRARSQRDHARCHRPLSLSGYYSEHCP